MSVPTRPITFWKFPPRSSTRHAAVLALQTRATRPAEMFLERRFVFTRVWSLTWDGSMNVLEITVQHKAADGWPVVIDIIETDALPVRYEGQLRFPDGWEQQLLALDRKAYGVMLGEALFFGQLGIAFTAAQARSPQDLQILLSIEAPDLKHLHWERLCAPIRSGGRWDFLILDQRFSFTLYLPSPTDRRFPPIGRRDLNVLVVVANPPAENRYRLDSFDAEATVAGIRLALGNLPHEILANVSGADGPPTLNALLARLTARHYTLLHVVAHGWYRMDDGETIVYLLDEAEQVKPVDATTLIDRLDQVQGTHGLPHFAFLCTCESAQPGGEYSGALGGLAQRFVRELGLPAVLAMTEKVTIATAEALTSNFYIRLQEHGRPDRALTEAVVGLTERDDVTVPALFSRLAGRPLFSDSEERALTAGEIEYGLDRIEGMLTTRAPVLRSKFQALAAILRAHLGARLADLSPQSRGEWEAALRDVNGLCEEVLDLNFRALALGKEPPVYDDRQPFRGLLPFRAEHSEFFFGRESLVDRLCRKLAEANFLAVLGASGNGKSSLVLAGLVPALQAKRPGLWPAYLIPGSEAAVQLESALAVWPDQPTVLVVDQFEELFTRCANDRQRHAFIDRLLDLRKQMPVVITLRADFRGDCALYPALKEMIQAHQELIVPLPLAELRSAMEQQAHYVGLRFEVDLSHTILDAVGNEPGAMPLLQHLLKELWDRRHGRWLLTREYRALGGIQHVITHIADELYERLTPDERGYVRNIFIRLTRLGDEAGPGLSYRDTRQRVEISELVEEGTDYAQIRALVQRLADAHLVVTDIREDGSIEVEVAHEALLQYWPRLCDDWLRPDRPALLLRQEVRRAALEWVRNALDDSYLVHRARRLEEAIGLAEQPCTRLNARERSYLEACTALQAREAEERLKDLAEMGWGIIFATDADIGVRDALAELLELRQQQATQKHKTYYREFSGPRGYRPDESMWQFLSRQGIRVGQTDWGKVPYYLLIVGDPETIPFNFQYQLATQYAVGRIHFDTLEEYRRYAWSVVAAETGKHRLPRRVSVFAPQHPNDFVTKATITEFAGPLIERLAACNPNWSVQSVLAEKATKAQFLDLLGGESTPALLLAAGHTMEYPNGDERQLSHQGAFLCQDWPGTKVKVSPEHIVAADDIIDMARPFGLVAFLFGSCTAGTPHLEDFPIVSPPRPLAPHTFIARLPQRLLGHPAGGALAVVGHVDRCWLHNLYGAIGRPYAEIFTSTLQRAMEGFPIGAALKPLFERYAEYAPEMSTRLEQAMFNRDFDWSALEEQLTAFKDARNYLLLGDPAVRVAAEPAAPRVDSGSGVSPVKLPEPSPRPLQSQIEVIEEDDLGTVGWGVIFSQDADPTVREALGDLLVYRRQQATCRDAVRYQEFIGTHGYRRGEDAQSLFARQPESPESGGQRKPPRFLLLVGDPETIPWTVQHELARHHAVGRLHFSTLEGYRHYARSVIAAETPAVPRPNDIVFFAPLHAGNEATRLAVHNVIDPLVQTAAQAAPRRTRVLVETAATKAQLHRLLGGPETPAFLFSASLSITSGNNPASVGALICQDVPWSSRQPIQPEAFFSGDDVSSNANLLGLIAFLFTSFGVGTTAAVGHLPQKLLGHAQGGALAVIGSHDQLSVSVRPQPDSLLGELTPDEAAAFVAAFLKGYQDFLIQLLGGRPVGAALAALWEDQLTHARWMLIGDPAVRLPTGLTSTGPGLRTDTVG
jgi:hypothetical protein